MGRPRSIPSHLRQIWICLSITFCISNAAWAAPSAPAGSAAKGGPTPAAAAEPPLTIDFKETDIRDVLRVLAAQRGVSITYDESVRGNVTIRLTNVTFLEALQAILTTNGYTHERDGNVIRVMRAPSPPPYSVQVQPDGKLTLTADNAPVKDVVGAIVTATGLNAAVEPAIGASVSLRLRGVTPREALEGLAATLGYTLREQGPVLLLSTRPATLRLRHPRLHHRRRWIRSASFR